jgi:GT2 family glycosyltransferase
MPVSVVIANYNGCHILKACLSENMAMFKRHNITDVIIADDASTDDSIAYLQTHFPEVRVVQNSQNSGFSITCNKGASLAKEDVLLLLNNDMVFKELNLTAILTQLEDPDVFAITPKIIRQNKEGSWVNESPNYGYFAGGWFSTENDFEAAEKADNPEGMPLLWACGGAMFMKKKRFDALDGFDPIMSPFYCEDLDLSYRGWKRGWKSLYTETALCHHQHQATIGVMFTKAQVDAIHLRNKYLFIWKNITHWPYIVSHILTVVLKCFTFQINDTRAILNACFRLPKVWKYRRQARIDRLTDPEILAHWKRS